MERKHRKTLDRNRIALVEGLKVDQVCPTLRKEHILSETEFKRLDEYVTNQKKAEELLDVLKRSGPLAYQTFVDALKVSQPYLAELLISTEQGGDFSRSGSECSSARSSQLSSPANSLDQPPMWPSQYTSPIVSPTIHELPLPERGPKVVSVFELPKEALVHMYELLDRDHPFGDDWRRLYELIGLPLDQRKSLDTGVGSPTERTLFTWQSRVGEKQATTKVLLDLFLRMQRQDLLDVINEAVRAMT